VSKQITHEVMIEAIKFAALDDKQLSLLKKKIPSNVVMLDFGKLVSKVKEAFPEAKDASIRQRIYNINAKLKKEAEAAKKKNYRQFKFKSSGKRGKASVNYTSLFSFEV